MTSPDPIATLRASHEWLRGVVAPLTPEQVRGRAYPSEWSIADTLSHIGSGAEINSMVVDAGLAGDEPPPRDSYQAVWDRWNAKSPDDQAADAITTDAALVEKIEGASGTTQRFQLWLGEVDIVGVAAARLFEQAVHTWDVAVASDPATVIPAETTAIILSGLDRLVGFTAKPGGRQARIHVSTTDPAREFLLTLADKSTLAAWDDGTADATLRLPGEAFVRLVYGRLDADHTPTDVDVSGISLDELRAIFPGF